MFKSVKYLVEQGARKERVELELDLLYFIGEQPVRWVNDEGQKESDAHYNRRLDAWFEARKLIIKFFDERSNKPPN